MATAVPDGDEAMRLDVQVDHARFTSQLPPLSEAEFQSLKNDIRRRGLVYAIVSDEYGTIIDGANRHRAVTELNAEGVKIPLKQDRVPGLSEDEKRDLALALNCERRQLTLQQRGEALETRRRLVEQRLVKNPRASNREIGRQLHVDHKTVAATRDRLEQRGEIEPQERTVGGDGKTYPAKRASSKADNKRGTCRVCELDVLLDQDWAQDGDVVWHTACVNPDGADDEDEVDWVDDEDDDGDELEDEIAKWIPDDDEPSPEKPFDENGAAEPSEIVAALTPPAPAATPKPLEVIRVDNVRQAEKLKDLAEAGRLGDVMSKGINAAHKQLREHRRHEEIREHAAAASVDGEQLRVECMDALGFLRSLPTCSADMIWTDPPYYIASRGGGTKVGDSYTSFDAGGDGWDDDQWDDEHEFLDWLYEVVRECNRVLKPTGNMVMCMDRALISHLWDQCRIPEVHPHGLNPKNVLAWHKTNAAPNARGNFDSSLELAVWAAGPQYHFRRPATGQCSSVWSGAFVSGPVREQWPHPTAKPVAWIQSHLEVLSTPGQVVVDPFGGSGATVEAALRLGRRVIANDRAAKFANMCRARGAEIARELGAAPGWEEAILCAGCRQPVNDDETEETSEGRMHAYPCAYTWRVNEEAVSECGLCGKKHNANEGSITDFGTCCDGCANRAYRAKMKPTRPIQMACPVCRVKPGKRCKNVPPGYFHDDRTREAMRVQQEDFTNLGLEVAS